MKAIAQFTNPDTAKQWAVWFCNETRYWMIEERETEAGKTYVVKIEI